MASILSAGTTSATAMVHTADTSGVLQLASNNGTVALTINTSQQIGIGTASPSYLLDVQGIAQNIVPILNLRATSLGNVGGMNWASQAIAPTMTTNAIIAHWMGTAQSTGDSGHIGFKYAGTTGSNSSCVTIGTFNKDAILNAYHGGWVTMPYQPMFSAFATNATGLTTDATRRIMPFQTEQTDVGGNYDTTTSRFTAPVAGTYFFQFYCLQLNGTASHFYFYKNGAQLTPASGDSRAITASSNEGNVAGTGVFTLAAGDYIQVYYNSDSGGNVYGAHGGFSGFLVG